MTRRALGACFLLLGLTAPAAIAQTPLVLFSTSIVDPGQTLTVQFRAPSEAGAYPYACTFPGHWRIMNGMLTVRAAAP